jgi:hypothetical protein
MKKFLALFIFLLALGGTGFYFGWVQLDIPPQTRGIIFTKTWGWDTKALTPGAFAWRWEKLIPGNFSLYVYPDKIYTGEIRSEGSLPSAEVYSMFLDGSPDFRYSLRFTLSYRIRDEHFAVLARDLGILPEGLEAWLSSVETDIGGKSVSRITSLFTGEDTPAGPPEAVFSRIFAEIRGLIGADYPFLELTGFAPLSLTLPDMALYAKGREIYFLRADSRKETLRQNAGDMTRYTIAEDRRLESLKKYGALLSEYPVLLDFLKVEKSLGPGSPIPPLPEN